MPTAGSDVPPVSLSLAVAAAAFSLSIFQFHLHRENRVYLALRAAEIVRDAGAVTPREKVVAIRDYLRANVNHDGFPIEGRPFFRHSGAEILRTGKGWCGEVTRAFIVLAREVGIPAQRINLYGRVLHVVAEAEVAPGERVVVDSQNPPYIPDLEPLDKVIQRPEFDDYYTVNLRRLRMSWLVTRVKFEVGPLTYILESPNRLKAILWLILSAFAAGTHLARLSLRALLHRRGWVHRSAL